jgi:transposase InsO family protein
MAHPRAKLTVAGRELVVRRIVEDGWPAMRVAEAMGISRATAYEWLGRFRAEGLLGLADRSSRPRRSPRQLSPAQVHRILAARRQQRWGPHRLAPALRLPRSTIYTVLRRHQCARLRDFDPPTGVPIRYVMERPGQLIHIDVKKLGRIPPGGGHRLLGRELGTRHNPKALRLGTDFVHVAVDDASRLAFVRVYRDERGVTASRFLQDAAQFFGRHGMPVQQVMTDCARSFRTSICFREAVRQLGARHLLTRPYRPRTNGKAERFIQTLIREWAYTRLYPTNDLRLAALPRWVHFYNSRRTHTALGSRAPLTVVNNVCGNYS